MHQAVTQVSDGVLKDTPQRLVSSPQEVFRGRWVLGVFVVARRPAGGQVDGSWVTEGLNVDGRSGLDAALPAPHDRVSGVDFVNGLNVATGGTGATGAIAALAVSG